MPPTAQKLVDYQHRSLDIFIRRVQTIEQYVDDATALKAALAHLFINMTMCTQSTKFNDARLQLIVKLNSAPIRYGMSQQWDEFLREAIPTIDKHDHYHLALVYGLRARIAYDRVYRQQAYDWGKIALQHAYQTNDAKLISEMAQTLGNILIYHFGAHQEAFNVMKESEAVIRGLNIPVPFTLYITWVHAMRFMGNIHQARALSEKIADKFLKPQMSTNEWLIILNTRGIIRWSDGAYALAEPDLIEVAQIYEQRQELAAASGAYGNLGLCYWSWSKFPQAKTIYQKALKLSQEAGDVQREMKICGNLGLVYLSQGRFDLAEAYIREHIHRAEALGAEREANRGRGNLVHLNFFRGRLNECVIEHIEKTLGDYAYPNEANGGNHVMLALYYQRRGDIEKARSHLNNVWQICDEGEHTILPILAYRLSAEVYPEHAEANLRKALELAQQHERQLDVAGCLLQLAKVCDNSAYQQEAYQLLAEMDALYWLENGQDAHGLPLML